jgi:hypothetical protein
MALIKDYYQPQYEITIAGCYWKIDVENGIGGGKNKLRARLNCFKNQSIADTNQNKYADFDFDFTPDLNSADNFIKQAYVYVKTLPEFSGAIDVI